MSNELEKAIRFFKNMRDDNKVVLDSGFGMKKGENNLPYKNRKKYAELAIDALEKQIAKKSKIYNDKYFDMFDCPNCKQTFDAWEGYSYCPECGQKLNLEA